MMDDLLHEMINPAPVHHDAPRRRRLWTTVAIVGLAVVGATTLTTAAVFTDNDAISAKIESGTVDLAIGQDVEFTFAPQNLAPGDSTFAPLQITSTGSLALRYSMSFSATPADNDVAVPDLDPAPVPGDLRDVLQLFVYDVAPENCTEGGISAGTLLNGSGAQSPWPAAVTPLVGSNAQGPQSGDRTLDADTSSEWLCFRVDFPLTPDDQNQYQGAGVQLDLTFNAEQTANN